MSYLSKQVSLLKLVSIFVYTNIILNNSLYYFILQLTLNAPIKKGMHLAKSEFVGGVKTIIMSDQATR